MISLSAEGEEFHSLVLPSRHHVITVLVGDKCRAENIAPLDWMLKNTTRRESSEHLNRLCFLELQEKKKK